MFRIKICGITTPEDAQAAVDAGADALGLNFYEKSPRCVTVEQAKAVVSALSDKTRIVGVFVNCDKDEIDRIRAEVGLHGVQLHGDEPPELVAYFVNALQEPPSGAMADIIRKMREEGDKRGADELTKIDLIHNPPWIIRARRLRDRGFSVIREDIEACKDAGGAPGAILVDALTPGRYGGTGETVSWAGLADHKKWVGHVPLILAGGLNPYNVAEAVRIVRPHGVDVASGVEISPGRKDVAKMRLFVAAARTALSTH